MNALAGRYRHTIVALDRDLQCAQKLEPEVAFETMAPPRKSHILGPIQMARLIRKTSPDVVLTYNWGAIEGILGARLAGVRRIIHAEDGFGGDEVYAQKMRRILARRGTLKLATRVVVPSRLLEGILTETWHVPRSKALCIANGIDMGHYSPGSSPGFRRQHGIPEEAVVLGTVAKLRDVKGLELLIESFPGVRSAQHPEPLATTGPPATSVEAETEFQITADPIENGKPIHLVIVGDGPEQNTLKELARSLSIENRVTFPGQILNPLDAYRAMDIFALTSVTEQMPVSVVEAMACGLPVVATNVGDVQLMVASTNQPFIIEGRDVGAFRDAITQLITNPSLRETLGKANRVKCCTEYGLQLMLDRYQELYDQVLAS